MLSLNFPRRNNIRYHNEDYYDDEYDEFYYVNNYNGSHRNNEINQEMNLNSNTLESLISIQQITNFGGINQEIRSKKYTLNDFIQKNLTDLKEDLVYYFSSTDSLIHYKNNSEEEIKYMIFIKI